MGEFKQDQLIYVMLFYYYFIIQYGYSTYPMFRSLRVGNIQNQPNCGLNQSPTVLVGEKQKQWHNKPQMGFGRDQYVLNMLTLFGQGGGYILFILCLYSNGKILTYKKTFYKVKFCAAQLIFGLVELEYRYCFSIELAWGEGGSNPNFFFFIFYLVRLWLGCIPRISSVACLEVPQKFVWWSVRVQVCRLSPPHRV